VKVRFVAADVTSANQEQNLLWVGIRVTFSAVTLLVVGQTLLLMTAYSQYEPSGWSSLI